MRDETRQNIAFNGGFHWAPRMGSAPLRLTASKSTHARDWAHCLAREHIPLSLCHRLRAWTQRQETCGPRILEDRSESDFSRACSIRREVAGIIHQPIIQGEGGTCLPPKFLLAELQRIGAGQHGNHVDRGEVQVRPGRTWKMVGAFEHSGKSRLVHLLTSAKGISIGHAASGAIICEISSG